MTDARTSTCPGRRGGRRAAGAVQPAGQRPEEHQLRRRQRLRQGHATGPGHRQAGRVAVGEGLGRRPRHAHRGGPRGAPAGRAARPRRRLPGGRARGRDGRRVRLLRVRQGRRRPVDRHRDARPRRGGARRPPAPRRGHRVRDRGGRRGTDPRVLRRPGRLGPVAAPRLPARPGHRRDQARAPRSDRRHPRRPRHHRLGRHERRVRGALPGDHRDRAEVHRRARQAEPVRQATHRTAAGDRTPRACRGPRPDHPRPRVH